MALEYRTKICTVLILIALFAAARLGRSMRRGPANHWLSRSQFLKASRCRMMPLREYRK
jgi:hypothetical protein